jgi:GNAT superfamily N-acetyltransferase
MSRDVTLLDGTELTVRPIEPGDRDALAEGFERLGAASRYSRFLAPMGHLSEAQLRYLTDVDHHDHEALVAFVAGEDGGEGEGVGVARFVRLRDDPAAAEFAVTVADDWQGHGIGTALLALLADRAREEGIDRFRGLMLARNRPIHELVEHFGEPRVIDRGPGTVEVEVDLPPAGAGEHLQAMLRAAARGEAGLHQRATASEP